MGHLTILSIYNLANFGEFAFYEFERQCLRSMRRNPPGGIMHGVDQWKKRK
jgi:hypothetical protein